MTQKTLYLGREPEQFTPGQELVLESFFEQSPYGVVFEDDCGTGYFYAVHQEEGILDALHIYNVEDLGLAALDINGYIHAVFDFAAHAGYCRNAFPEASGDWLREPNRLLSDELLDQLLGT